MRPFALGRRGAALCAGVSLALAGCAHVKPLPPGKAITLEERRAAIRRASVWSPTNIPSLDLKAGAAPQGYAFNEWVTCTYEGKKPSSGRSAKFLCTSESGQELKVKYGGFNAEVLGEVIATRLFWALGFAADHMYPVRVRCRGCPKDPAFSEEKDGEVEEFDPAAIERKIPGRAMESSADSGWKWKELEDIGPEAGPDARAHRDALKLLAAFVQHTDSKRPNQRLLCPEGQEQGATGCRQPVLMVQDLGLTFGRGGLLNRNKDSVNLKRWAEVPVWRDRGQCVAQLAKSFTGSLGNPKISEAGRAFLAGLLQQLSDAQLRDLFEAGRVQRRPSDPRKPGPPADADAWVEAFKRKRAEIVDARCPA